MSEKRRDPDHEERLKERRAASDGLEGAAGNEGGLFHEEEVEGGDELSLGGGPPSAAGGVRHSPLPNRDDVKPS